MILKQTPLWLVNVYINIIALIDPTLQTHCDEVVADLSN